MTVLWYVDYPKVLNKDPFEVTKFDQYLLMLYGNKLKVNRDKWLPRNEFGLFRDRDGKLFDDKIPTKDPRWFSIWGERDIDHPGGWPSISSKRRIIGRLLTEIVGLTFPPIGSTVAVYELIIQEGHPDIILFPSYKSQKSRSK